MAQPVKRVIEVGCPLVVLVVAQLFLSLLSSSSNQISAGWRALAQQEPPSLNAITVGEDRPVSIGASDLVTVEPYLAANPRNSNHLIAGVMFVPQGRADLNESSCAALTSFDAGQTWTRHDFPIKQCFDPWVAIRQNGSAVFVALAGFSELVAFRSEDGGKTWTDGHVSLGKGHDHGTLTVDLTQGLFAGSVYAVSMQVIRNSAKKRRFAVFIARSEDGGATFGEPQRLELSNLMLNSMNPAILSDGTLVVPYSDFRRSTGALLSTDRDWLITSADAGKTFSAPLFISDAWRNPSRSLRSILQAGLSATGFTGYALTVCASAFIYILPPTGVNDGRTQS